MWHVCSRKVPGETHIRSTRSLLSAFVALTVVVSASSCKLRFYAHPGADNPSSIHHVSGSSGSGSGSGSGAGAGGGVAPPPTATLSGTPADPSTATALSVTVGGAGVTDYKYKLGIAANCALAAGYSASIPVATLITDTPGD